MANQLKMTTINAITTLHARGWKRGRIARELGIDPRTVSRYVAPEADSKCTKVTAGSRDSPGPGSRSQCGPFAGLIEEKLALGLTARRIYQDLVIETGFEGSYESVKRFARGLKEQAPQRVWRLEVEPGEEAQVDFGTGAPVAEPGGRPRRPHVLRVVLSFSRKAYSEAVWRQTTESFIRVLENAFREFGGAPQTVVIDNLKAAVTKADWFDPELNPKVRSFARHYGTVILPARPYCPQHKGKVERGIGYVKNNALKGRRFANLREQNDHLFWWERHVADKRIHGTTRKQVEAVFEKHEKPALLPLPAGLFPCFEEWQRTVHRDSYVEVQKAYYEAPQEYIGRPVWVRWDARTVRIYNRQMEQVSIHARLEPGRFTNPLGRQGRRRGTDGNLGWWRRRAVQMGAPCGAWAEAVIERRGELALRVLQGLVSLNKNHSAAHINGACQRALQYGTYRLRDLKRLLGPAPEQETFTFLSEHPLIRDMKEYGQLLEAMYPTFNYNPPREKMTYE